MDAAAVVTIIAVILIVLALVIFLVAVILELRKITAGLDVVIGSVGEILRKTEPVEGVVKAINADLAAGTELLEGLLLKKAGPDDAPGLVESVYPGAGVAMLERQGRPGEVKNIDVVYTRGAVQLVRLGRESPLGAGGEAGPALRDPALLERRGAVAVLEPGRAEARRATRDPRSPTIGTDARPRLGGGVGEAAPRVEVDREAGDRADAYATSRRGEARRRGQGRAGRQGHRARRAGRRGRGDRARGRTASVQTPGRSSTRERPASTTRSRCWPSAARTRG